MVNSHIINHIADIKYCLSSTKAISCSRYIITFICLQRHKDSSIFLIVYYLCDITISLYENNSQILKKFLSKALNTIRLKLLRLYRFDNDDDNKMNGMSQTNFQMRFSKLDLHQRHKKSSKPQVQIRLT